MTAASIVVAPPLEWRLTVCADRDPVSVQILPGQVAHGGCELGRVTLRAPCRGEWALEIDDEILAIDDDSSVPSWTWVPGFFAGEVLVRLVHLPSAREAEYRLDVSPDPAKLGRDVFSSMLRTLWSEAPELLVGQEPARHPRGSGDDHDDSVLAYGRLRRHGFAFVRALEAMAAGPITKLRRERRRVPLHLVRRSDRRTVLDLARTGEPCATSTSNSLELLDVPSVEPTLDNPANRLMLAGLQAVLRRTRSCKEALAERVEREQDSETRTTLTRRWPARREFLRRLEVALRRLRRRRPFVDLERAEVSQAGLNAVASHPVYTRAHRIGWLCTRRGFAGAATAEDLWLPPTWEIYERWCWIALRRQLEDDGFEECEIAPSLPDCDAAWSGRKDADARVTLLFQPRFPSWSIASHRGARSLSSEFRPDIALVVEKGDVLRFDVFDAKYRTSRQNVLDAMKSAHVYHDALRLHGRRPDSVLLLVPAGGGAPWLESDAFRVEHRVGVRVMAPDGGLR